MARQDRQAILPEPKVPMLLTLVRQTQPALSGAMSIHPSAPQIHVDDTMEEPPEEMGEGDSQNSYKDSAMSSVIDFDPDDSMVSQQTAATEVTQPLRSRISQVSPYRPQRLELDLEATARRNSATPTTACPLQSPDEPNQHSSLSTPYISKRGIAISRIHTEAR